VEDGLVVLILSDCNFGETFINELSDFSALTLKSAENNKVCSACLEVLAAVAYLGYGRHGTCHGRHFDGGRKNCLAKLKSLFSDSLTSILPPMHS